MTPSTCVLLSCSLSFGLPLALAARELLMLRASPRSGDEPPREEHFPRAPKPLPDCLLPAPVRHPPRTRVLEEA